jgi:carboxylesterase
VAESIRMGSGPGRALLIHGFTGTPWELSPLAERLAAAGYTVHAPLLPGHGSDPRGLDETRWHDWYQAIEAAALELGGGEPIAVGGLSLGGLLTLHLTYRRPALVRSLATMAAALRLTPAANAAVNVYRQLGRSPLAGIQRGYQAIKKRLGADVADAQLRYASPGYKEVPLHALASLVELGGVVRGELGGVHRPTLVLHGRNDHTVPFSTSLELERALGAPAVRHVALERSYHQLPMDLDRDRVADEVIAWFDRFRR